MAEARKLGKAPLVPADERDLLAGPATSAGPPALLPASDLVLDALGNPVRRQIVVLLADAPRSVGQIAAVLPISRPAVSKHLRLMARAGLVRAVPAGVRMIYGLVPEGFDTARVWLDRFWSVGLSRLQLLAENTSDPWAEDGGPDEPGA